MMKEKVNTHFSFPLRLDMTPYTEDFLMGKNDRKEGLLIKLVQQALSALSVYLSAYFSVYSLPVYRTEANKIKHSFNQPILPKSQSISRKKNGQFLFSDTV